MTLWIKQADRQESKQTNADTYTFVVRSICNKLVVKFVRMATLAISVAVNATVNMVLRATQQQEPVSALLAT